MDSNQRREAPDEHKEYVKERQSFRNQLRKKEIQKVIWSKRNPIQGIKGYDLSKCWKKRKFQKKKCWECGSTSHLIANCPVHREYLLRKRVTELERKIQELEASFLNQLDNKKKRERRKRKKEHKKKKKKHQRKVKAMRAAVIIKDFLLKEEQSQNGQDLLKGAAYLDKLPRSDKQRAIKAYKEIYGGDCVLEIAEAFCEGDELYEELETRELGIGPIKAEVVEQAMLDVLAKP